MTLAISDDHVALADAVRRWVGARETVAAARAVLEVDHDQLPPFQAEMAELGWVGLAVSEGCGGSAVGVAELAVVVEQLGRGCVPGPFLPTAVAATAIDRWVDDAEIARKLVEPLLDGRATAGVGLRPGGPVLGGALADVVLIPVEDAGGGWRWIVASREDCTVRELPSFDPTRRLAHVEVGDEVAASLPCDVGAPLGLMALVASAESLGLAQWCVDTAAAYAAERTQFGRPIGQFQAVKHRCADMLVDLEAARALVWDAARAYDRAAAGDDAAAAGWRIALDAAASRAPEAAFRCAKDCIQTLGGIGYTWEHDAHIFLKRATAMHQLLPSTSTWRRGLSALVAAGEERSTAIELPAEAEQVRDAIRADVAAIAEHDRSEWNGLLAESGLLTPHWPTPWGRGASPIEQLVIDEELARAHIRRPHLQIAGWVLPTIVAHGTAEQQERWVLPSMRREITWCQMFSEPGAGSDLASLTTRAVRVDGERGSGWSITGQKVWTTMAHLADWAICLARTDPDVPRHEGIGCFLIDMTTPGIDIRPLRELTGMEFFNEVFLDDVFVPDDCLVGGPTQGWECARTTLANERVSMSSGSSFGPGIRSLFELAERGGHLADALVADELGGLVATAHAVAMLGVRTTLRALGGAQPGPEASVRKLLGVTHEQDVQEVGLSLLGADGAVVEGDGATWTGGFLGNRALSIAGGTSDIQRNVIAERLLGLPKDP
jgi:alkylation response protein AidB-like acyl-CoA dehydrogenase